MMYYADKLFLLFFAVCQADELRLYLGSIENYTTAPVDNASAIVPYMNMRRPTCFYTHGIKGGPTVLSVTTIITALIKADKCDVVLLDWHKEAAALLGGIVPVPVNYGLYNTPNAEVVGYRFGGIALPCLINNGLSISNILLMGHSLGAQVMGIAGRHIKELGFTIPKIVGLDPAGPGFTTQIPILPTLDTTCANTVIIIHTDPNGLGSDKATGHIDFFPNYNKTYTMQPGCTQKANPFLLNNDTTCSHNYSWQLILASMEYPNLLKAEHAMNGDAWLAGLGNLSDIATISIDPTPEASGSYFLWTVAEYPYGLGEQGLSPK